MLTNGSGFIIAGRPVLPVRICNHPRLRNPEKNNSQGGTINILVRAPNWLGDIMLCTPALSMLRKIHPEAVISVLVKSEIKEVLSGNHDISELITLSSGKSLPARLKFYRSLKEKRVDLAILFTNSFETALCSFIASAKRSVGYNRDFRRLLLTDPVSVPERRPPRIHQSEYYLNLVRQPAVLALAGKIQESQFDEKRYYKPVFCIPDSVRDEVSRTWTEEGLDNASFVIGLGPGAAFGTAKRWPPARYSEFADTVVRELGGKVVIFGSTADREVSDRILSNMRESSGAVSFAGRTSIKALGALLERCDAYVTNDSGPMHMAAALDTPVVAIFGPTDPSETAPLIRSGEMVREPVSCSPCWKRECSTDHRCMESVSVRDVFSALLKILRKKTDRC